MDDMQSRIAARRAEIERQRRAVEGEGSNAPAPAPDADMEGIFDELFKGGSSGFRPATDRDEGTPGIGGRAGADGKMQDRVAARRAEIDRDRVRAEVEAAATAEREWADRARTRKAQVEAGIFVEADGKEDPAKKAAMDRLLREAVWRRWTANQKKGVGITVAAGIVLLLWSTLWGAIVMLLGAAMYASINSTHRAEAIREYPDLFRNGEMPKVP